MTYILLIKLVTTKSCNTRFDPSCPQSYKDQTNQWQNSMKKQQQQKISLHL